MINRWPSPTQKSGSEEHQKGPKRKTSRGPKRLAGPPGAQWILMHREAALTGLPHSTRSPTTPAVRGQQHCPQKKLVFWQELVLPSGKALGQDIHSDRQ